MQPSDATIADLVSRHWRPKPGQIGSKPASVAPKFRNVYSDEDGVLHADAKTVDANPADLSSPTAFGGAINGNQN